ncbi:NRDE family protein [Croceitalea rosinachiae]|uniref:NRDE family protein n=1 Tax=Croceitalea rosinachiae TaxID=3075596 RepID=A0ABU3A5J6_9FLAO|nr:NRDE family protein [Croceitalea sp. F388]MDT0605438.1 NRDE family protein [Croceitalea sp. F388]
MCTVSFIPVKETVIITSNRDEHISRPSAYKPCEELINGRRVLFPKDPKAGGTWFAVNEDNVIIVLLNGAFQRHTSKGNYAKSRGLILLDLASHQNPKAYLEKIDLVNIEPFTVLVSQEGTLNELRWDGSEKFLKELDSSKEHIWSSATLYDKEVIRTRETLFADFISKGVVTKNDIIAFHSGSSDDLENGFIIERKNGLKTFSVTQAVLQNDKISLEHLDLLNQTTHKIDMNGNQLIHDLG